MDLSAGAFEELLDAVFRQFEFYEESYEADDEDGADASQNAEVVVVEKAEVGETRVDELIDVQE